MKIKNAKRDALPSNITLREFGQAMAALDLTFIPEHKRAAAIMDHLGSMAAQTVTDPEHRATLERARLARAGLNPYA